MKLIIQIPCFNEEEALPVTLKALPSHIDGFDKIEVMVVDDGSSDSTVAVAKSLGVHHVEKLPQNRGASGGVHTGVAARD